MWRGLQELAGPALCSESALKTSELIVTTWLHPYPTYLHSQGNYWWAREDYLATLDDPNDLVDLLAHPNGLDSWRHNLGEC